MSDKTETYSLSSPDAQYSYVSVRTAATWLGFALEHFKPGSNVLDCGCGPGSITLDLAERVFPGFVIGLDVDDRQLRIARSRAKEVGVKNVAFVNASIYSLPFSSESFDIAVAHTLLYHLKRPERALVEMRRVLRGSGVAVVADDDIETSVFSPAHPLADRMVEIWRRLVEDNGGSPSYSRHLRRYLLDAGFARSEGFAVSAEYYGNLNETRRMALVIHQQFLDQQLIDYVVERGWSTASELADLSRWILSWGERPDAFMAIMYCAAVGWAK